jgi:hypothetical protein
MQWLLIQVAAYYRYVDFLRMGEINQVAGMGYSSHNFQGRVTLQGVRQQLGMNACVIYDKDANVLFSANLIEMHEISSFALGSASLSKEEKNSAEA